MLNFMLNKSCFMQNVCLHGTKFGVGGDVFGDHEFERSCRKKKNSDRQPRFGLMARSMDLNIY